MKLKRLALVVALAACAAPADVAITNVTILDVAGGTLLPDQSVLLSGRHIYKVQPSTDLTVPTSARVINGRGKYLMPGLWDMHVHTVSRELDFPLEVANGITGIRDMGGSPQYPPPGNWGISFDSLRDWRAQVRAGTLIGPRIVAAGIALDGPEPFWPQPLSLKTPAQARSVVDSLHREGIDFVKVYMLLPKDILLAIADEAGKQGLTFAGHPSQVVAIGEAAAAGQRSFEHGDAFEVIYYDSLALRPFMMRSRRAPFPQDERAEFMRRVLATYDGRSLDSIARLLRTNNARFDPTLVMMRSLACIPPEPSLQSSWASYVPGQVRTFWDARISGRCGPKTNPLHAQRWERQLEAARLMHQQGVTFLVGSDAWNPDVVPGFSLHDELEMLVTNGMAAGEALRAATVGAAEFLQMTDSLGAVTPGMLADLVLLDANPLEDIRNTRRVSTVVLNGRVLERTELDRLLSSARASLLR